MSFLPWIVLLVLASGRAPPRPEPGVFLAPASPDTEILFGKADVLSEDGRADTDINDAVFVVREIIARHSTEVWWDGARYRSVRSRIEEWLEGHPDVRDAYLKEIQEEAAARLREATGRRDPQALAAIRRQYPLTEEATEASIDLGRMRFAERDPLGALRLWWEAWDQGRGRDPTRSCDLALRMTSALLETGDDDGIERLIEQTRSLWHTRVQTTEGDRTLLDRLMRSRDRIRSRPRARRGWAAAGIRCVPLAGPTPVPSRRLWSCPLPRGPRLEAKEGEVMVEGERIFIRYRGRPLSECLRDRNYSWPVVDGDRALLWGEARPTGVGLADGHPLTLPFWEPGGPMRTWSGSSDGETIASMVSGAGPPEVFAIEPGTWAVRWRRRNGWTTAREEAGVSAERTASAGSTPSREAASFGPFGCPYPLGDRIFVPIRSSAAQVELGICSRDASTGNMIWSRPVLSLPRSASRTTTLLAQNLASSGGIVWASFGIGAIAGLDAATGDLEWITPYAREKALESAIVLRGVVIIPDGSGYAYRPLEADRGWERNPILPWELPRDDRPGNRDAARDGLVALPRDGTDLLALEASTGEVLWSRPRGPFRHLLGTVDGLAYLGGDEVAAIRLESGKTERVYTNASRGRTEGRGAISRSHVYVPSDKGILVYDRRAGSLVATCPWAERGERGALIPTPTGVLHVTSEQVEFYGEGPHP